MKKISSLFLSLMLIMMSAVTFVSCSDASKVDAYVDLMNEQLPKMSQAGVSFGGAKIEGKKIVIDMAFEVDYSSTGVDIKDIASEAEKSGVNAKTMVAASGDIERDLLEAVANEGYSIVYRYKDASGATADAEVSNADLKAELN